MRFTVFNLGRAGLCLAIWLFGALGASELGATALGRGYVDLINPSTFQEKIYRIRMPDVTDPSYRIPVVVILHDAGRNGAAIVNDESLIKVFVDKGYAVIAPDALTRRNARINYNGDKPGAMEIQSFTLPFTYSKRRFLVMDSNGTVRSLKFRKDSGWYFYNVDRVKYRQGQPKFELLGRNEIQFLRDVLDAAEEECGVDPKPVLIIGLGHGGSLVWQIACYAPKLGQILAPVGGAFWRKIPTNCKSGANLVHTNQRASAFWPLKGIKGNKRRYARTSIYRNLDMLRRRNGCDPEKTTARNDEAGVSLANWTDCEEGSSVELMVLDKKFAFQTWWLEDMLGRIERSDIDRTIEEPVEIEPGFKTLGTGTGFQTPGTGTGFQTPGAGTAFKAPGSGTGFKTPGTGTGFKTPGTGTGSRFKRLN